MLKKYKNELFIVINETNLSPLSFSFEESTIDNGVQRNSIIYKDTGLKLMIDENPSTFHSFKVAYTRFEKNLPLSQPSSSYQDFESIKKYIRNWLNNEVKKLIDEEEEEDFWDVGIINNQFELEYIDFEDESPFSDEEKEQVVIALEEARFLIKNKVDLSEEQKSVLDSRIDYLIRAVDRTKKTDWKTLTIGGIMSTILNLSVDANTGRMIWEIMKNIFSSIPQLPM